MGLNPYFVVLRSGFDNTASDGAQAMASGKGEKLKNNGSKDNIKQGNSEEGPASGKALRVCGTKAEQNEEGRSFHAGQ